MVAAQRAHLQQMRDAGGLDLPLPAGGRTAQRWAALADWGGEDLVLARLAEGHTDAVAVLAEAGSPAPEGALLGVWASASEGTGLRAARLPDGGLRLDGVLRYASGARVLDAALVTATDDDGLRHLVLLDVRRPGVDARPGTWAAVGMDDSDSLDVAVDGVVVPGEAVVGPPGFYVERPGLHIGGLGVAALWWGGARGVVRSLTAVLARGEAAGRAATPHQLAHLGAASSAVQRGAALLAEAAAAVDASPEDRHRTRALRVRHEVEQVVEEVLRRSGRASGATPLCRDADHARRVADLTAYVRQQHAEGDLERLGRAVLDEA
ncbi:hypothetical protein [uncultured Pseudokineococcus sp.]|uniref:hypothetical protein n=1 Tax=uncultured Pseudokineococcus sp. TaxID=1642928 RepID=UPI002624727F|nr:hypothetical protein [uncultured Pseudokineococcus sp.]